MNDDGLQPGQPVNREDYQRIDALHRKAKFAVIRGDYPDWITAITAIR